MQHIKYGIGFIIACGWCQLTWAQKNLNADEFNKKLDTTPNAQVLDVRTPEEYSEGRLKNAKNINIQDAQFESNIQTLDKNKPVFVYCLVGGRSSKAMELLVKQGFKEVYNLDGGYMKWSLSGKPTDGVVAAKEDEMSSAQFEETLKKNALVLVDYNAKWCGPCKKLLPIVDKLRTDYASRLTVMNIDVDKNKKLAKQKGVESLPALVLYKKGKVVWQQLGLTDEATLKAQIEKNM